MSHLRRAGRMALAMALLGVVLMGGQAARADTPSSISTVQALGSTAESPVVYAASTTGLYRAAGGPYASWDSQATLTQTVTAVSPDPGHPNTVVIAATQESPYLSTVYRSVDGGRTLAPTTGASGVLAFARPAGSSSVLYAAGTDQSTGYIYRSSDAGLSWTTVYSVPSYSPGTAEVTAITVDPSDPTRVLAAVSVYHGGMIVESRDGGTSWHDLPDPAGTSLMTPYALAINPRRPAEMWVAWGLMGTGMLAHTVDGGHHWTAGEAGLPPSPFVTAISYDTLSGRVYVDVMGQGVPHRIYASGDRAHFEQFSPGATDIGLRMAVVSRGGYIVTGDESHRLWVGSMIGALRWNVGAPFAGYYASVNAARLLGRPISPLTACGGVPCQYFEKARLEDRGHGAGTPRRAPALGRLGEDLLALRAALPVGGATSTATYASLAALARPAARVAPPAHFKRGVAAVSGGTFVPFSAGLGRAPGQVVPPYFWTYMTNKALTPGGWEHDLGLPLTKAIAATVTKGAQGRRHIYVQAFQSAILTYDPANPPAWRVERANLGVDYTSRYPERAR